MDIGDDKRGEKMSVNSIRNLLEEAYEDCPEKLALIDNDKKFTYSEIYDKVNQVARYLKELKLKKGGRVGVYSNKNSEKVIAILALLSTDYVFVPITRLLKSEQVQYIINDCDIECIITDKVKIKNIEEINFRGKIITFESLGKEYVSFEEIYKCYSKKYKCSVNGHDNAVMTYSFGLSGFPKGVVMTHRNLTDGARVVSKYLDIKNDDVISGLLSFSLDYGLNQIFCALYKKAAFAVHTFFLPADFFSHLIRDKVTILPLMPINITQMFDEDTHKLPSPKQLENIRTITSSGGNVTSLMINKTEKYFTNALFYSMHGLDEAFRSAYLDPKQIHIRPNSIGKAIPDVELYIINEIGEECKPREIGEMIHRGLGIYKGYWKSPEDTKNRFKSIKILEKVIDLEGDLTDEIVVASGDYVYKDEEGYIYLVSRKDDMIKTSGYRVNPYEIESVVLNNFPTIKRCAVFSIENKEIEEEIVMIYSGVSELPKNEVIFELKKHLPNYMIPSIIAYKKNMPLMSKDDNKIDKAALKKEILSIEL